MIVGGPGGIHLGGAGPTYVVQNLHPPMPATPMPYAASGVSYGSPGSAMELPPPSVRDVFRRAQRQPERAALLFTAGGALLLGASALAQQSLGLPALMLVGPTLGGLACLGFAAYLWARRHTLRARATSPSASLELRLIHAAAQSGGSLTVMGAALALGLPLDEVDAALMALARAGHANLDNDPESGSLIYSFPDLQAQLRAQGHLPPATSPSRRLP